ncbi:MULTISPECIES: carbohydrate ABC transporter permease [unclassified Oceanispirochaeta]|uniref:carbohydrate ABC transporter permease n=1 Tax=unclassified Oceanispirochaeta TaxID=2635722 RepID=UPI000E09255B|nr:MULTISPECIES: sugar ABC transporter permease [unclassified Oceanispirochaeta]MBF9016565.1 sugar ABC transporter permease [Oceanispirochaeta sp. M2]NPD73028.1 sugar ABC transporter permease [Oceanispirochaeta sp. M1]RDG31376.1 sugar ABC transporter permease [Oceanispirochaeta sp. M1]
MNKKSNWYDIAFVTPGLLVYMIFLVIPLLLSFYYSFTNWNGLSPHVKITGVKNYILISKDPMFLDSLWVTLKITVITALGVNTVGLLTAGVLNKPGGVLKMGRTIVFIPAILSAVVASFIWSYMTQTNGGIINIILKIIHLPSIDFYQSKESMVFMVSGVISWAALGFYTTIYIANMKTIPLDIYEAAEIDGASPLRQFFSMTIPMLRPAIIINSITAIIWGLKQYDFVKVMIPGYIQTVTIYAIERAFEYNMFGYSSAVIIVLLILTLLISLFQMKIMNRKEISY